MLRVSWTLSVIVLILMDSVNQATAAIDLRASPGAACDRVCKQNESPRTCYFEFHLENYQAMGVACGACGNGTLADCSNIQCVPVDGVPRGVVTVNRQISGPPIIVCKDDLVVVDVINRMNGLAVTLHFHGEEMATTNYMDGVPFLTQCPIQSSTSFRYAFDAANAGTQFYHANTGHQKVDGLQGALIVRTPKDSESNKGTYDFDPSENIILISDWSHQTADMFTPGIASGISSDTLLINGHGQFLDSTGKRTATPLQVYKVDPNGKYRFRIICAMNFGCPVQIQVEGHKMKVIATDGVEVVPVDIDTLFCAAGERYDVVINTNQSAADYWIRTRLLGPCQNNQIEQFATLRYGTPGNRDVPLAKDLYPAGATLNFPNTVCFDNNPNDLCLTELAASVPDTKLRNADADVRYYLVFNNYLVQAKNIFVKGRYINFMNVFGGLTFVGAINGIQYQSPSFPPLTQPSDINATTFCDAEDHPEICGANKICPCTHRMKIRKNDVVELVLIDGAAQKGSLSHVFSLHGYRAMVTNMGQGLLNLPADRKLVDGLQNDKTLPDPPANAVFTMKDTISIPNQGYVKLKFRATNEGLWALHCFLDWHNAAGMAVVLQVGDAVSYPPADFPKCGNFLHPIIEDY